MFLITSELKNLFLTALTNALGKNAEGTDPQIQPASRPEYGDFQANFALALAKKLGQPPRTIAENVSRALPQNNLIDRFEISGPGFVNIHLNTTTLAKTLDDFDATNCKSDKPETIIIDYGGANIAKEMHVGHLRSLMIGDAMTRYLMFRGHNVLRRNHLGDWGTQFGMLIEYLFAEKITKLDDYTISDLNQLYQQAKKRFDDDEEFAVKARKRVVALQKHEKQTYGYWQKLVEVSEVHFEQVYELLGVLLEREDNYGESVYNDMLEPLVDDLLKRKIAVIDRDAVVVFLSGEPGFTGDSPPQIIRKADGGYLYATTDIAAVKHRVDKDKASRLIYVNDARQIQHFAMLEATCHKAGYLPDDVQLQHMPFGTILGKDGKPFKTRSGKSIPLQSLIDEALKRAEDIITKKNPDIDETIRNEIAKKVGIGALKYADLANERIKDYVFDWDKMLAFDGNTAPYVQNAYVRIQAIFRRGEVSQSDLSPFRIILEHQHERLLALKLFEYYTVIENLERDLPLHKLCRYLFELASLFHQFYENCPVLSAPLPATKNSRLKLCYFVADCLEQGLELLGIETVDRM